MTNQRFFGIAGIILVIFFILVMTGEKRLSRFEHDCSGTVVKTPEGWRCIESKTIP